MGRTPNYGLPYPDAETLITDSAAIVQELAEKIDGALGRQAVTNTYDVPGTVVGDFTTSGTFTPPQGVAVVSVVIIGGGGNGGTGTWGTGQLLRYGLGGPGGGVRVFRDVPVAGPVPIVVGANGTASSFGNLTAPGGRASDGFTAGYPSNADASCGGGWLQPGQDGVSVNGTFYAGGGGGSYAENGYPPFRPPWPNPGGKGGGGDGAIECYDGRQPSNGANGFGGGGGGSAIPTGTQGGSGRVLIFAQTAKGDDPTPQTVSPDAVEKVAGLSPVGVIEGVYAADPDRPEVPGHAWTVHYPTEPQATGRRFRVVVDQVEKVIEEKLWPGEGWQYADGVWVPPGGFPKPARPRITAAYPLPDSTIRVEWGVDFGEDLVIDRTEVRVSPATGDPTGYSIKGDPREYVTGKFSPGTYRVEVRVEILAEWSEWAEAAPVTISTTEAAFIGGREWDGGNGYRWLIFDPADTGIPTTQWEITRTKAGASVEAEVLAVGPGGAGQGQTLTMGKGGNGGGGELVLGTLPPAAPGSIMVTVGQGGKNADGKDPADSTVVEGSTTVRARAGKSATTKADAAGFGPVEVPQAWQAAPPFRWNLPDSAQVGGSRDWDKSERPNGRFEGQGGGGTNSQGPQRGGDGHDGVVVLRWRVS